MKFRSKLAGVVVSICLLMLVGASVSCEDTVYSEVEENGSPSTANAFPLNNKISGRISPTQDTDLFSDTLYGGNTYTYTVKDMTADLQLLLYKKTEDELGMTFTFNAANEVDGPGNESLVYVVPDTQSYIDVYIQVESPVGEETSYWLVKSVE